MAREAIHIPRVTFVSSHAKYGGSERYLEELVKALGAVWVRDVVCLEDGPLVERLARRGHEPLVLPTSSSAAGIARSAWRLRHLLREACPDVVHANGIKAALVSVIATALTRIPVVWVKHDFSYDGWPARAISARCRRIVAVSSAVTETFTETAMRKTRIVHTGITPPSVDRSTARAQVLEATGSSPPAILVALVGRLHPVKGHMELVAITPLLRERVRNVRIVFIGAADATTPHYATALRRRVEELKLDEVVCFLGHRSDAPVLMAGCDVVVIASGRDERGMGKEGFPLVALESLSVGTPVVAYADGGVPEVLGPCGILVAPGDRKGLEDAIAMVATKADLAERLSRCGRDRVSREFTRDRMIQQMQALYRETVRS